MSYRLQDYRCKSCNYIFAFQENSSEWQDKYPSRSEETLTELNKKQAFCPKCASKTLVKAGRGYAVALCGHTVGT